MENQRSKKTESLAELANRLQPTTSIAQKIQTIHNKIALAKAKDPSVLNVDALKRFALKVCADCGIKESGVPDVATLPTFLKSWNDLFVGKMNTHELLLAFEMNVNGELEMEISGKIEPRVNHYQCFSREFFCEVCRRYLIKKAESNKILRSVENNPGDNLLQAQVMDLEIQVMRDLIHDRQNIANLSTTSTVKSKLEIFDLLFEFHIAEDSIVKFRKVAINTVMANAASARNSARTNKKLGKEIEMANKVERLKIGPITEKDESEIQHEVTKLIYGNALLQWSEFEFVKHVEDAIEIAHKNICK